jgi:two-component sensor histidine kinase
MALAPLLILAVIQSLFDYQFEKQSNHATIALSAHNASAAIIDTMDSVETLLKVVSYTVEVGPECNAALTDVLESYPRIDDLAIVTPSGEYLCHGSDSSALASRDTSFVSVSVEKPYSLKTLKTPNNNNEIVSEVVMSYGDFRDDLLEKIVVARIKLEHLRGLTKREELAVDMNLGILNAEGDIILGPEKALPQNRKMWVQHAQATGKYSGELTDADGVLREIYTIPSIDENVFIAVSIPKTSIFSWSVLHPFSSLIMPILAWLFGFIAIWLATEKLILTHIRRLRRAARRFANGDQESRVGDMGQPPQSIESLGSTFDKMADEITTREAALVDSLDEKEILLREIHHRVKNNLQIIISLLNMQERKLTDPKGLAAVRETRNRINAISLVHRGLYESADLRYVDMLIFIRRLAQELGTALGCHQNNIKISVESNCSSYEADTAIPVALFIVEAIVNAAKHGAAEGGAIDVAITETNGEVCVSVSDSGDGFSEADVSLGTGSKLMRGFARQLGGRLERKTAQSGHSLSLYFTPGKSQ